VTWTDWSTTKEFWMTAHKIGDAFPPQMLTLTLKSGTVAQGTFAGSKIRGNTSMPPNSWEGTLTLVILPDNELVAVDYLDIQSVEIGLIKSPLFPSP
jgi:hypothetical protein